MNNKQPQLEDIAEALGLSKSTVSRAISGKGRVSEETRSRVNEYIEKLGYRPNSIAKSLSEQRTYNIGVTLPIDGDRNEAPFFHTCLTGICRECGVSNYDTVVIGTEKRDFFQLRRIVEDGKIDGVIITRPYIDGEMEKYLKERGVPFTVIGRSIDENAPWVDSDHYDGCRELTSYLLMNNDPDKIALVLGNMDFTVNQSRYLGFSAAYARINSRPNRKFLCTDVESKAQISAALSGLLREQPECIICGDDVIALDLISDPNISKMRIPEDIRIASFYNSVFLEHCTPPVTSLIFDAAGLGARSAAVLIALLNGGKVPVDNVMGYELIIRRSTM